MSTTSSSEQPAALAGRNGADLTKAPSMLTIGLGGLHRQACVALAEGGMLLGVCAQERVTRVRQAGVNASGLPDEALDLLLERHKRSRASVGRYVTAEVPGEPDGDSAFARVDHHFAHACTSYLSSPFDAATIVVCDHEAPYVSVWRGSGASVTAIDWPWEGPGFSDLYSQIARLFGLGATSADQRLEALARLEPDHRDDAFAPLLRCDGHGLDVASTFEHTVEERIERGRPGSSVNARCAAALQSRVADLFCGFLDQVRRQTGTPDLCLGGSFFYHSSINTATKKAGLFSRVFVPVDPGNGGLGVGTALQSNGATPRLASPFLGPAYDADEIKSVLDNCKLEYSWESEAEVIDVAVHALQQGRLVGWFDGGMEWGPRALGARCILASPFSPYVLENLNRFLKRREAWRGYALSGLEPAVAEHFYGPATAPFMECDYRPKDPARFRAALPSPNAALRVQTVDATIVPRRFARLLEAFGAASGVPCLINTSFNGFHEPIVCDPRDAVRVFYGSGLDLLVLDQFVLRK